MPAIPETERKLDEARHFLGQLRGPMDHATQHHNLSAFLNAASSVRWVLQKEAKAEYDAWQPGWFATLSDGDRGLLKTMTTQRNLETKEDGATVSVTTSTRVVWQPKDSGRATPLVAQLLAFGFYGEPVPVEAETLILKLNGEPHEIHGLCARYVTLLEHLVADFKSKNS